MDPVVGFFDGVGDLVGGTGGGGGGWIERQNDEGDGYQIQDQIKPIKRLNLQGKWKDSQIIVKSGFS
jgi:hypothetical protein